MMFKLVKLGNCVHVYDLESGKYVKSTAANVRKALDKKAGGDSRKTLVMSATWVKCDGRNCRVKDCQKTGHWFAGLS